MTKSQALFPRLCRIAALAAVAVAPALAVDVTYNTTGSMFGGGGTVFTGPQELTIAYIGLPVAMAALPGPSATNFGTFDTIGPRPGFTDPVSTPFSLVITETAPSSGTETLTANLTGTMQVNNSTTTLTFTGGSGGGGAPALGTDPINGHAAYSFTLGTETFWVDQATFINPGVPAGACTVPSNYPCAPSTIDGAVASSAVPEPAFYALTGLGFAGLMAMAIRRRRQKQTPAIG